MSGSIVDDPIRHCPRCGEIYLEDNQIYEEPDTCPACGASLLSTSNVIEEV
jgi:ribosomal protein S27AE